MRFTLVQPVTSAMVRGQAQLRYVGTVRGHSSGAQLGGTARRHSSEAIAHAWSWQTRVMGLWSVVIPVKSRRDAKSRFAPGDNSALALAMALDTVSAAVGSAVVGRVIVVSSANPTPFEALGAWVLADPGGGLGAAVSAGVAAAPPGNIAVLLGDLPGLRARELSAALESAEPHPLSMIADADGTGTTMAAATGDATHDLAFGAHSRAAHLSAGYVELSGRWPGLQRDVDLPGHLAGLALGPRTRAELSKGAELSKPAEG